MSWIARNSRPPEVDSSEQARAAKTLIESMARLQTFQGNLTLANWQRAGVFLAATAALAAGLTAVRADLHPQALLAAGAVLLYSAYRSLSCLQAVTLHVAPSSEDTPALIRKDLFKGETALYVELLMIQTSQLASNQKTQLEMSGRADSARRALVAGVLVPIGMELVAVILPLDRTLGPFAGLGIGRTLPWGWFLLVVVLAVTAITLRRLDSRGSAVLKVSLTPTTRTEMGL